MPLTPEDVERQVFKEKIRGYDMEEVDAFLDRVVERMRELEAERDRVAREAQVAVTTPRSEDEDADLLRRTLVTAQRAADQTLEDARAEAERMLSEARLEAAREREQVQEEAEQVARSVEDLKRFRREYAERVRTVIADHLRAIDQQVLPDFPDEADELAQRVAASSGDHDLGGRGDDPAVRSALDTDMAADPHGGEH